MHTHHQRTLPLLSEGGTSFAVAAHSVAETFSTLTRLGQRGYGLPPAEAIQAIDSLMSAIAVLALSASAAVAAVRSFAADGHGGPLIYDRLIGEVALRYRIPAIVTWNTRHMAPLFPQLRVVTPPDFVAVSS